MPDEREYTEERYEQWRLSRRGFLVAGAAALAGARRLTWPASATAATGIVKPLPAAWFVDHGTNAETRWEALRDAGFRVPNARFFVRNHTATPAIDPVTWRLRVFGSGLRRDAVEYTLRDLLRLPSRRLTAFIECAGNGRSFFAGQQGAPASGTPWRLGAIGVAEWKGVPLGELLERAGIRRDAVDVLPQGARRAGRGTRGCRRAAGRC
jgi:DMSO/TMAO reductase YedYZ molybdopterin-dependent catalytic subunit